MKNNSQTNRQGFTLLELIVTTAMLAALTASCMVIVRTSYTSWHRHEGDHTARQSGLAVLKHIVRQSRQCRSVLDISNAAETSGTLSLLDTDGNILVWEHNAGSKEVLFGVTTASDVLATGIEELNFVGLKVDGTTQTTDPGLIHAVHCTTKVDLTRPASTETVTNSCRAWIRSW